MAEKSGFFNARETGNGTYDRVYDAEQFAEYFSNFVSNGVYANPANQLKVVFEDFPNKPFIVIVRKGKAYIDGYWYELTEDMEITIPANTKSYVIKDVVCCTLDKAERKVSIVLKEGVKSDYPTNNSTQHELVLSTVVVQPNASRLNAEDITDKRPDKTYCGFVTGVIDQIDTTELFKQYDDAFNNWFDEMKYQLSTDAAGNLQKQVGLLSNLKTIVKDSIVNAVNSLYDSIIGKTLKTMDEVKSNTKKGYYVDALAVAELGRKIPDGLKFKTYTIPSRTYNKGTNNIKNVIDIDVSKIVSISGSLYYARAGNLYPISVSMLSQSGEYSETSGIYVRIKNNKSVDVIASSIWEGTTLKLLIAYMG